VGAANPAAVIAVVDDLGTEVLLPAAPQRIVSLAPSNTELLFALGLGERIVGVTKYCNYPPAAGAVEQVAGFSDLSVEKIAAVRPDLVVASRGNDAEGLETVRQMGIPVFALANNSVAEVIESVRRLGQLTGRQQAGERLATVLQARIDTVTNRVASSLLAADSDDTGHGRPRVLWGMASEPIYTAGASSIIDDVIEVAGGANLGREAGEGWPQVSLETVVDWQVDVLLMSLRLREGTAVAAIDAELARMRGMDGWRQLPAVKTGRLVHVDGDVLTRAGPRIVDAVELLAKALHPDAFGDRR
jgi:iron complex transport system substrate-binding protein